MQTRPVMSRRFAALGAESAAGGSGVALVALGSALWGLDGLFRRGLALDLPATSVVLGEHLVLVALTLPWTIAALRRARSTFSGRDWASIVAIGAGSSVLATALFTQAFVAAAGDPTTPVLMQKVQPLVVVALAHLVLKERLQARYGIFFAAGLVSALLVAVPDLRDTSVRGTAPAALAGAAAGLWALGTVLGRRLTDKVSFADLTVLRFAVGLPFAIALGSLDRGLIALGAVGWPEVGTLFVIALGPGLAALLLYYRGLRRTSASVATLAELSFPLTAVLVNHLAFGVTPSATQWIGLGGLALTLAAMAISSERRLLVARLPPALSLIQPSGELGRVVGGR